MLTCNFLGVSSENHDVGKYIKHKNYNFFVITITYNLFSISFLYCVIDAITYIKKLFKKVSF